MSWVVDEWKDGLPAKALQKIQEMETKLERLGKEQKQKQFQMESLEAAYQKQVRIKKWIPVFFVVVNVL